MQLKKAAEVAQKKEQQLVHDECYLQWKWISIHRVSSDNKLDGIASYMTA